MPQIGNDDNPVVFKNKKKGNRKLGLAGKRMKMTRQERQTYNKNFDRIFGKPQKNFNCTFNHNDRFCFVHSQVKN